MIKVNELRIGNKVGFYKPMINEMQIGRVEGVYLDEDDNLYKIFVPEYSRIVLTEEGIKPIPLTEEILLKCGFEKLTEQSKGYKADTFTYTGSVALILNWDGKRVWTNFWQGTEYKYLHQLQNLYFALTGEELNIEL